MNCPSCWRPIKFDEKYSKVISCQYCNTILEFWWSELSQIWQQSEFIEFPTIFKVWSIVFWNWKKINVKWQLRYEYDWWFFDRFFVIIDGKELFIEEDDWQKKTIIDTGWKQSLDTILDKEVWSNTIIWWQEIFIQETWIHKLVNIKWYVNDIFIPWKEYEYLDWILNWKVIRIEKEIWNDRIRMMKEA